MKRLIYLLGLTLFLGVICGQLESKASQVEAGSDVPVLYESSTAAIMVDFEQGYILQPVYYFALVPETRELIGPSNLITQKHYYYCEQMLEFDFSYNKFCKQGYNLSKSSYSYIYKKSFFWKHRQTDSK